MNFKYYTYEDHGASSHSGFNYNHQPLLRIKAHPSLAEKTYIILIHKE